MSFSLGPLTMYDAMTPSISNRSDWISPVSSTGPAKLNLVDPLGVGGVGGVGDAGDAAAAGAGTSAAAGAGASAGDDSRGGGSNESAGWFASVDATRGTRLIQTALLCRASCGTTPGTFPRGPGAPSFGGRRSDDLDEMPPPGMAVGFIETDVVDDSNRSPPGAGRAPP